MPFKHDWEQAHTQSQISEATVSSMVAQAFPQAQLHAHKVLAGGCANLNIKIQLADTPTPFLLRIYKRDPQAALREEQLTALLKHTLPVPAVYFIGEHTGQHFAITEFMPGISLRDLLLNYPEQAWAEVMLEVGQTLACLQKQTFPEAGFFDEQLNIKTPLQSKDLIAFVEHSLQTPAIQAALDAPTRSAIAQLFKTHAHLLPKAPPYTLVHGDFDPANILVDQHQGHWYITGILDWEFAHVGHWLIDVANMLRYAQDMPATFEHAFIQGLKTSNIVFPKNWKTLTHLYNLSALLDLLNRYSQEEHPKMHADIRELIAQLLQQKHPTI